MDLDSNLARVEDTQGDRLSGHEAISLWLSMREELEFNPLQTGLAKEEAAHEIKFRKNEERSHHQ